MRERLHYPSFKWYFEQQFDRSFLVYFNNWRAYVLTQNKYFTSERLKYLIIHAVRQAIDEPLGQPDGARKRSLLDVPLEEHCDALLDALKDRCDYIGNRVYFDEEIGNRYEWIVDVKKIQDLIIEVRRQQDLELGKQLLQGEIFMSDNLMGKKLYHTIGIYFSARRVREITRTLTEQGYLKTNGYLRTHGREVVS
jgi:hypothetical protein